MGAVLFFSDPLLAHARNQHWPIMKRDVTVSRSLFVDEINIVVTAGDGGHGCMAFRREKYIPHGGPHGGDGGHGGSVQLLADDSLNTLHHLAGKHHHKAERGGHGMGKNCHGKNGEDCVVLVPPGTLIYDAEHDLLLKDLDEIGQTVCVAQGGRGGKGNTRFKSSTNQAPREFEEGTPGQHRRLHLELKLMADVALVGKPNAGKSTLLSRLSHAKPKIASYPFTTLTPSLGIVELTNYRRFTMADIPGLIEGAHVGLGLGIEFLRHIERARTIVHIVDVCPMTGDPTKDYHAIRGELVAYSETLAEKPEILVANKMDLTESDEHLAKLRDELGMEVIAISAASGQGLDALKERIWTMLHPQEE
jgi:GTP-binding protein